MVIENKNTNIYGCVTGHYLISAICFLILAIMLFFSQEAFSGHYFQPRLLAITHMAALGWGTLLIFGATYQLLEFMPHTRLFSQVLAWMSLILFVPGLLALVTSFWVFDPGIIMQTGSILLFLSVCIFIANVYFSLRDIKQSIRHEYIITSCWWLGFAAFLGVLMVFNFRFPFLPQDHIQFLRLHAHVGIVGWFLLLIIGVSSTLVPRFLTSSYRNPRLLNITYYLINASLLLFLADTYRAGINLKTVGILVMAICGVAFYLFYIYKCFSTRKRSAVDVQMMLTFFSFLLLALAVLTLPFLIYYYLKGDTLSIRYSMLYGSLVFMGWITALILGQTFKTLPYLVWKKYYRRISVKEKALLPDNLVRNASLRALSAAFILFCLTYFFGHFFWSDVLTTIALVSLTVTAVLYIVNIAFVLLHPVKSRDDDCV